MLAAVFSFRGRLNRIQYFLGSWGLGTAMIVLVVLAFLVVFGGQLPDRSKLVGGAVALLLVLLVLAPMYFWVAFSLQARRFRDIGWEPVFVIPAWIGLDIVDRVVVMGAPQLAVAEGTGISWLGLLVNAGLGLCLLFWPGRPPFDAAAVFDDVPPPSQPQSRPQDQPAVARAPAAPAPRAASPAPAGFGRRGL